MKNKTTIRIWNPTTGESFVTLNELREMICERRLVSLTNGYLINRGIAKKPTVHTTDKTKQQVAAHYKSFQIRQFNANKAIEVFKKALKVSQNEAKRCI